MMHIVSNPPLFMREREKNSPHIELHMVNQLPSNVGTLKRNGLEGNEPSETAWRHSAQLTPLILSVFLFHICNEDRQSIGK